MRVAEVGSPPGHARYICNDKPSPVALRPGVAARARLLCVPSRPLRYERTGFAEGGPRLRGVCVWPSRLAGADEVLTRCPSNSAIPGIA